jgi:hypothetical protein
MVVRSVMPKNSTDPGRLAVVAENPFMTLFQDGIERPTTFASVWSVIYSACGRGHTLFWRSELTEGKPVIYTDNLAVTRFLQENILGATQAQFKDSEVPVDEATFARVDSLPNFFTEIVTTPLSTIRFTWYDFLEPFSGRSDPLPGEAVGHAACYFPGRRAQATLDGRHARGEPQPRARDGYESTSSFVALAESWVQVRPAG